MSLNRLAEAVRWLRSHHPTVLDALVAQLDSIPPQNVMSWLTAADRLAAANLLLRHSMPDDIEAKAAIRLRQQRILRLHWHDFHTPIECAGQCGVNHQPLAMYRCYECELYFCGECGAKHWPDAAVSKEALMLARGVEWGEDPGDGWNKLPLPEPRRDGDTIEVRPPGTGSSILTWDGECWTLGHDILLPPGHRGYPWRWVP